MRWLLIIALVTPVYAERVLLIDSATGRTRAAPDRIRVLDTASNADWQEWLARADRVLPTAYPALVDTRWGAWVHATGQWANVRARLADLKPDFTAPMEIRTARQDLRQARTQLGLPVDASIMDISTAALGAATNASGDRRLARVLAARLTLMSAEIDRIGGRIADLEDEP